MGTILGVVPLAEATPALFEKLAALGVVPAVNVPATGRIFIEFDGWSMEPAENLAQRISTTLNIAALAVLGQTTSDVYVVAEFAGGSLVRRISFNRDGGGWDGGFEGTERGWEADYHFAVPIDEYCASLEDGELTEADLAKAREAYETRDLARLPRLPDPSGSSMLAFLAALGADLSGGAHARWKKPGLLARLLGRA